jgi:hypothetical protein
LSNRRNNSKSNGKSKPKIGSNLLKQNQSPLTNSKNENLNSVNNKQRKNSMTIKNK